MAGDDEELQLLLSSFSSQPITDDINNLLFTTATTPHYFTDPMVSMVSGQETMVMVPETPEFSLDPAVSQLLTSSDNTVFYGHNSSNDYGAGAVETKPELSMHLSVASPESGIASDEAISPLGHDSMEMSSGRSLSNRIAFSPQSQQQQHSPVNNMVYSQRYGDSGGEHQSNMVNMLQQLSSESSELLAETQQDLARIERVKNNYRSSTVISGVSGHNTGVNQSSVFITGPNHRGTIYNQQSSAAPVRQSVIVSASRPKQQQQQQQQQYQQQNTYTNETFDVDFSKVSTSPVVISLPSPATTNNKVMTPVVVETVDDEIGEKEEEDIFRNFEISPKKDTDDYLCYVCGEKAGKHSYYGGQVCASCRAFFRRSVQSKYYEIFQCKFDKHCKITSQTRKTCQFCRFKKCLEAGMKPSWVLSDEERNRRFNKFNKINKQLKSANTNNYALSKKNSKELVRVQEIYITFTLEEQKLIEYIKGRFNFCRQSWLRNLMMIDRQAGINFIEAAYNLAPLKMNSFVTMQKSCHIFFVTKILPNFINLDSMPTEDQAVILQGKNSNLSHFFKMSQCLKIQRPEQTGAGNEMCPIQRQVAEIAGNNEMIETYDLSQIMSKLNLSWSPKFPTYHEVFPPGWTGDMEIENRHEQIMRKIQSWPFDENNQFDHTMLLIFCLVLLFSADFESLRRSELVENVQLKYTTLLQRYLKSKMSASAANRKFLDAIMLISWTREMWDINERFMQ